MKTVLSLCTLLMGLNPEIVDRCFGSVLENMVRDEKLAKNSRLEYVLPKYNDNKNTIRKNKRHDEIKQFLTSKGTSPTSVDEIVEGIVNTNADSYNQRLIANSSTRQYESATLPAKQLGNVLLDAPFSEK